MQGPENSGWSLLPHAANDACDTDVTRDEGRQPPTLFIAYNTSILLTRTQDSMSHFIILHTTRSREDQASCLTRSRQSYIDIDITSSYKVNITSHQPRSSSNGHSIRSANDLAASISCFIIYQFTPSLCHLNIDESYLVARPFPFLFHPQTKLKHFATLH